MSIDHPHLSKRMANAVHAPGTTLSPEGVEMLNC